MDRIRIPDDILSMAHARARARTTADWAEADRLRASIEAAGWRVVDRGTDFALSPAAPPDIVDGERVRYGASRSVPSRLAEPSVGLATIVAVAPEDADRLHRLVAVLRDRSPAGTSLVVVANDPDPDVAAVLGDVPDLAGESLPAEIVLTSDRLGPAALRNAGVRRAIGPLVVILDGPVVPDGDIVTPLAVALDPDSVAIVGTTGWLTDDLRSISLAPAGDADVVGGPVQAFRRADVHARGPYDERYRTRAALDAWWSLTLRDEGPDRPPRRAVAVAGLPIEAQRRLGADQPGRSGAEAGDERGHRRDTYRLVDAFGGRSDLLRGARLPGGPGRRSRPGSP